MEGGVGSRKYGREGKRRKAEVRRCSFKMEGKRRQKGERLVITKKLSE